MTETAESSLVLEGTTYRATVLAPDPCYVVRDDAETAVEGSIVSVTRTLAREDGICATVITPIEVTGPLPSFPSGATRFELRLRNPAGVVVSTVGTDL